MARLALVAMVLLMLPIGTAEGDPPCTPTSADPATYEILPIPGKTFYHEERNSPAGPSFPGLGFLLGDGTWVYEESNGLPGLQRGGSSLDVEWFAFNTDSVNDETCGAGPDTLYF